MLTGGRVALEIISFSTLLIAGAARSFPPSLLEPEQQTTDFWQPTNGPYGGTISALAASGGTLFAGTLAGVFRSSDNGTTWTPSGLGDEDVLSLAVSGSTLIAGTVSGVFRSNNAGSTWEILDKGLPRETLWVRCLVSSGQRVFAATSRGLFVWTDRAAGWKILNPDGMWAVAVSGNEMYLGGPRKIARSRDDGKTWIDFPTAPATLEGEALYISDGSILAGGRTSWRSNDDGRTWQTVTGLSNVLNFASSGNVVIAGTASGVFRSTDRGATWRSTWPSASWIRTVALSGTSMFAGTDNGAVRSNDNGVSWRSITTGLPADVSSFTMSGARMFAGTLGSGVFSSSDGGRTWTGGVGMGGRPYVSAVLALGEHLYAGIPNDGGVYRSADNGRNWSAENVGLTNRLVNTLAAMGASIFVGTNGGPFRSDNSGSSWSLLTGPAPISALAAETNTLFAGWPGGVWVSHDRGARWQLTSVKSPVFSIATRGSLLIAGTDVGAFRSDDDGQTWNATSLREHVTAVAAGSSSVVAGTVSGAFLSTDRGVTWRRINDGLRTMHINTLLIDESGYIFAGTAGGVFRSFRTVTSAASLSSSNIQDDDGREQLRRSESGVVQFDKRR